MCVCIRICCLCMSAYGSQKSMSAPSVALPHISVCSCVCVYTRMHAYVCAVMCGGQFETASHCSQRLMIDQQTPSLCQDYSPVPLGQMFNIDAGDSNSSPCARVAGTLPSPQANDHVRYVGCQDFFTSMMM